MNRSASHPLTGAVAAAMVTLGVLVVGGALSSSDPEYLAACRTLNSDAGPDSQSNT